MQQRRIAESRKCRNEGKPDPRKSGFDSGRGGLVNGRMQSLKNFSCKIERTAYESIFIRAFQALKQRIEGKNIEVFLLRERIEPGQTLRFEMDKMNVRRNRLQPCDHFAGLLVGKNGKENLIDAPAAFLKTFAEGVYAVGVVGAIYKKQRMAADDLKAGGPEKAIDGLFLLVWREREAGLFEQRSRAKIVFFLIGGKCRIPQGIKRGKIARNFDQSRVLRFGGVLKYAQAGGILLRGN